GSQYEIQYSDGAGNFSANTSLKTDSDGGLTVKTGGSSTPSIQSATGNLTLLGSSVGVMTTSGSWANITSSNAFTLYGNRKLAFSPNNGAALAAIHYISDDVLRVTDWNVGRGFLQDFGVADITDATKRTVLDCSLISASNTRTLNLPDFDLNLNDYFDGTGDIFAGNATFGSSATIGTLKLGTDETAYFQRSGTSVTWYALSSARIQFGNSGIDLRNSMRIGFSSGTNPAVGIDTGLERDSAGVLKVTDGSTGTGDLIVDTLEL
ncbi:unnamed protein product, partial [marine sediment metagenome]